MTSFRIDYLDGLRGLAALAVVLLHASEMFGLHIAYENGTILTGFDRIMQLAHLYGFKWGMFAVETFIVVSGYSLMLGVARSHDGKPKDGLRGYFLRRIQRIWPPYFWTLVLSLFAIVFISGFNIERGRYWDLALPALNFDTIASHMLFIQNLRGEWLSTINPPLWTIAVEEQIYILFPLLLLPFWRRGTLAMIGIALAFSIVPFFVIGQAFEVTHLWYLALFALGAAAASINFSNRAREMALRTRVPWGIVGVALLVLWAVVKVGSELGYMAIMTKPNIWLEDIWFGAGIACLLIYWTERSRSDHPLPRFAMLHLFKHPKVVALGVFTYSIYLMHAPILHFMTVIADSIGLTGAAAYAYIFFIGVPVTLGGTYVFHVIFERPFLPQNAQHPDGILIRGVNVVCQQVCRWRKARQTPQQKPSADVLQPSFEI
jgi:peptidoglycan/LPS O-acetylase OafA/YrhL